MCVAAALGAAALVGGVYSANKAGQAAKAQANAAGQATDAQLQAQQLAIAEQRRQYDTSLGLSANQRTIGNQALNALGSSYGFTPAQGFGADYNPATSGIPQNKPTSDLASGKVGGLLQSLYNSGAVGSDGKLTYGSPQYLPAPSGGLTRGEFGVSQNQLSTGGNDYQAPATQYLPAAGTPTGSNAFAPNSRQSYGANPFSPQNVAPGDYSQFFESPDYKFRQKEGLDAVQNSAAAHGGLYSGNALRDITDYASNLAAGEYGNYFNRQAQSFQNEEARRTNDFNRQSQNFADQEALTTNNFNRAETARGNAFNQLGTLAGFGNTATQQAQQTAMNTGNNISGILTGTANNIGNNLINSGNARASGINGQADAFGQTVNNLGQIAGYYYGNRGSGVARPQDPYGYYGGGRVGYG